MGKVIELRIMSQFQLISALLVTLMRCGHWQLFECLICPYLDAHACKLLRLPGHLFVHYENPRIVDQPLFANSLLPFRGVTFIPYFVDVCEFLFSRIYVSFELLILFYAVSLSLRLYDALPIVLFRLRVIIESYAQSARLFRVPQR